MITEIELIKKIGCSKGHGWREFYSIECPYWKRGKMKSVV
jgi:hypothetical protein